MSGVKKSAWSHDQQGADEQGQEAPEEEGVGKPAVLDPEHLLLAEDLGNEPLDPLVVAVEPVERFALPPDRQPLPEPPGQDAPKACKAPEYTSGGRPRGRRSSRFRGLLP